MLSYINYDDNVSEIHTRKEDGHYADLIILKTMKSVLLEYVKTCQNYPDDFFSRQDWLSVVNEIITDINEYLNPDTDDEIELAMITNNLRESLKLYAEYFNEFGKE